MGDKNKNPFNGDWDDEDADEGKAEDPTQVQCPPFILSREWLIDFLVMHYVRRTKRMQYNPIQVHAILDEAIVLFEKAPSLEECEAPVHICGDIHGQYSDLLHIFNICGHPPQTRYLFLGDYIDRGVHSLEVINILLANKVLYPKKVRNPNVNYGRIQIHLLRGNHEMHSINSKYGFRDEVHKRFGEDGYDLYRKYNQVFNLLPLAGIVSRRALCMHGGTSPALTSLEEIRKIKRPIGFPEGLAQDLLWADPNRLLNGYNYNPCRKTSYMFGKDTLHELCKKLDIDIVIRGHQTVQHGYEFFAKRKVMTVFSAARYHDELWNSSGVVVIDKDLELYVIHLRPQEHDDGTLGQCDVTVCEKPKRKKKSEKEKERSSLILSMSDKKDIKEEDFDDDAEDREDEELEAHIQPKKPKYPKHKK